jgi:thiol-activated cytolysin
MTYSETNMSSVEEGVLKLGASYKWFSGNVSGSFSTNAKKSKTMMMVRFVQSYYTVSCEPFSAPDSFIHDSFISHRAVLAGFSNYVGPQNPPAYIASVTYGRELWLLIQSDHESNDVMASLSAAFNFGVSGGHADMSDEQKKVLNESSIQTMILGGMVPQQSKHWLLTKPILFRSTS